MQNEHWSYKLANYVYIGYASYLAVLWMFINYGGGGSNPYNGSGMRWYLITIPLFIYMGASFLLFLLKPAIKFNPIFLFLTIYSLAVFLIAVIHLDVKHFSEIFRWTLPIILMLHFKTAASLGLLNTLFIAAIVIIIVTYDPVESNYGFLPGQTTTNLHQGLWWRVSIWKYVTPPYSAAFSIIVFFANYFLNKSKFRYVLYVASIYFLLLSASRTGYLIFSILFFVVFLSKVVRFKLSKLYIYLPITSVVFVFALQFFSDLIPMLGIQNEFLNSAILRNNESNDGASNLSSRFLIILEHIRLIQEAGVSGIFGIGSEIHESSAWTANGGRLGGTADSYISHLIARDGISLVFLIFAFIYFFIEAMRDENILAYLVLLSLLLYTIGYGAWLNLTSPLFVLYLGFLFHDPNRFVRK